MRRRWRTLVHRGDRRTRSQGEQELATTFNSIAEAVIATDRTGKITRMNPVAEALTGWRLAEAMGLPLLSVFRIVEASGRVPDSKVSRVLDAGPSGIPEEATLIGKDGGERPIAHSSAPIRDEQGNTLGVVIVFRDITGERRAQEALLVSEERLRMISRATNDAVWDWDMVSNKVVRNECMASLFGYHAEQIGPDVAWWSDRVHPDDRERVFGVVSRALAGGAEAWSVEYRFRLGDGSYGDVFDRAFVMRDGGGVPVRAIGAMMDNTERKQMQDRLVLADRMASLGTLAAGVAHEINNPLAYVIANIGFAAENLRGGPEEVERALEEALEGAERVRRIVRDLKALSRAEDDRRGPVDIRSVLESTIHMAENAIRHRARLIRALDDVPPVLANESRLGQVFLNLIINAVEAVPEGAADNNEIQVSTRSDEPGRVVIAVSDTGPGIPKEIIGRIFDPFFTSKPVGEGTGLGLAICHGIVTQLGGEIRVESEVGKGSTFSVVLPAAAVPEVTLRATPVPPSSTRPGNVLVVDDEPLVGRSVQRTLARHHRVTVLQSGREALRMIAGGKHFDAILCDLMMPQMTGMDLYEELRQVAPDQAACMIFISGGAFSPRAREFLEKTTNPCLEKPFEPRVLQALIRQMIRQSE